MNDETLRAVRDFVASFEAVFDDDWEYTKEMLGIGEEAPDQEAALREIGLVTIPFVSRNGTFLKPLIEDEIENWGNRGALLQHYRRLKALLRDMPE